MQIYPLLYQSPLLDSQYVISFLFEEMKHICVTSISCLIGPAVSYLARCSSCYVLR